MPRFKNITGLGNVQFTPEEEAEADARELADAEEKRLYGYKAKRQMSYPSTGDQLDYIFHHGLAKWKTDIVQPIKDKYPKPSK